MSDAVASKNGIDLAAFFRDPAWHRKGEVFAEEVTDYRRMLTLAGLDKRTVESVPVFLADGTPVPKVNVTTSVWADGTTDIYGAVGDRYGILQDDSAFSILQSLADGARWETAFALYDGRKVVGTLAFDHEIVLDPEGVSDVTRMYAMCVNSHDGTSPFLFSLTPTRVVCANTLAVAMGNMSNVRKIRHTGSVEERAKVAAELWRTENEYADRFAAEAKAMFEASFSDKQFENAFSTLFPKPEKDTKGSLTKWENKRGDYFGAWNAKQNAPIKGTAWGAWNALTEANQWMRQERDGSRGTDSFVMAGIGLDGPTNKFRTDTLAMVKARANVKVA